MGYVDYTRGTGIYGGQMLVRVADQYGQSGVIGGNQVKFFVRSGSTQTWIGSPGFGTSVYYNNAWVALANVANYSNSTDWREVGTITVSYSQTIIFHINASGTGGFGGPTDFNVSITRPAPTTRPSAPGAPSFSDKTTTSVKVSWAASSSNGGASIDGYLLRYWPNAAGTGPYTDHSQQNNLSRTVTGLSPGLSYRFRVYAHNSSSDNHGYSNPSADSILSMTGVIRIKSSGVWINAVPYVKDGGVWKPATPYIKDGGIWKPTS